MIKKYVLQVVQLEFYQEVAHILSNKNFCS